MTTKKRRAPRMTSANPPEVVHRPLGLEDERIQNERILVSGVLRRRVAVFAKMNGYTMPVAWRKLVEAGLAAQKQGEGINYGSVARAD